ncbi:MAG: hypothetical protein JWM59_5105, partial [Verrucomicrobiales bacterium]|nr:hypothetical protein [Verrucomicrobiales bacterium]
MTIKLRNLRRFIFNANPALKGTGTLLFLLGFAPAGPAIAQGVSDWTPPVGIPTPSFGIKEDAKTLYGAASGATYDYADDGATGAVAYRLTPGGDPYTHYIDPSSPTATDANNPNGTAGRPRRTLPSADLGGGKLSSGTDIARVRLKPG